MLLNFVFLTYSKQIKREVTRKVKIIVHILRKQRSVKHHSRDKLPVLTIVVYLISNCLFSRKEKKKNQSWAQTDSSHARHEFLMCFLSQQYTPIYSRFLMLVRAAAISTWVEWVLGKQIFRCHVIAHKLFVYLLFTS